MQHRKRLAGSNAITHSGLQHDANRQVDGVAFAFAAGAQDAAGVGDGQRVQPGDEAVGV